MMFSLYFGYGLVMLWFCLVVFWLCFGYSVCELLVKKTRGKCVYGGYVLVMFGYGLVVF